MFPDRILRSLYLLFLPSHVCSEGNHFPLKLFFFSSSSCLVLWLLIFEPDRTFFVFVFRYQMGDVFVDLFERVVELCSFVACYPVQFSCFIVCVGWRGVDLPSHYRMYRVFLTVGEGWLIIFNLKHRTKMERISQEERGRVLSVRLTPHSLVELTWKVYCLGSRLASSWLLCLMVNFNPSFSILLFIFIKFW